MGCNSSQLNAITDIITSEIMDNINERKFVLFVDAYINKKYKTKEKKAEYEKIIKQYIDRELGRNSEPNEPAAELPAEV